jgi:fascin 1/2
MSGVEVYHVGLVNFQNKYLTAESFGFQVNASGVHLKKKQMWIVEQDASHIFLKSHLGRYLTADKNGKLSCEAEEREDDAKFTVTYQADGKLALKSKYDRYLGGEDDQINAFATSIGKAESWTLQLAIHPQLNLLHVVRKRYAHLESNEVQVSEDIPWGADALITLEFQNGKYALITSDSRYLNADGSLDEKLTNKGQYLIEFHEGRVAFRTHEAKFLTCVGNKGKIQSSKKNVAGRDEQFSLVDNHPQCMLTAQNERMVSIRQGRILHVSLPTKVSNSQYRLYCLLPLHPGQLSFILLHNPIE